MRGFQLLGDRSQERPLTSYIYMQICKECPDSSSHMQLTRGRAHAFCRERVWPLLPLWLHCRLSCMPGESLAPSSASLRLVALSSDRRLVTSWLADWMAPSMRWASCLLSAIIFTIFA